MSRSSYACLFILGWLGGLACSTYALTRYGWLLLFLLPFRLRIFRALALAALGSVCGSYYMQTWRTHSRADPILRTVSFSAIVDEPPDIRQDSVLLTVRPTRPSDVFSVPKTTARLLVKVPRYPTWSYGDELFIQGAVEKPEAFESFNYPKYLERFHAYGIIHRPKTVSLRAHNRGSPWLSTLYSFRSRLERRIQLTLPEPESSFLGGILLGSKRAIPENIQEALQVTGTSHIVAISGANITILLGLLMSALPLYSPRKQLLATACIGLGITLMTGASASVMRGAFVAAFSRYLRLRSRRAWPLPFILVSMSAMLLGNPLMLVADPGFQLSFGAFAGLAYCGAPLSCLLEKIRFSRQWPEVVRSSLAETGAATIGTSPVSFVTFGRLSLLGLIVNPLVLWLLPAISALGLLLLGFGWMGMLSSALRIPLWLLLHAALSIIQFFSRIPGAHAL